MVRRARPPCRAQAEPGGGRAHLRPCPRRACGGGRRPGKRPLWHERDISHSSAERVVLPDAFLALDYMLDRFVWLVEGLVVRPEQMRRNLEASHGLFFSQRILLALVAAGLGRDEAYRLVQRNAMRVGRAGLPFAGRGGLRHRGGALRPTPSPMRSTSAPTPATRTPSSSGSAPLPEGGTDPCLRPPCTWAAAASASSRVGRRPPAARRERPHLDLRRRRNRDPRQGTCPLRAVRVLVRTHGRDLREPPPRGAPGRPLDGMPTARDAPDRVRRARVPRRLRVEGLHAHGCHLRPPAPRRPA